MEAWHGVFVKDNQEGIDRVKKGSYAYLMESTSIEYETERDCDLISIGNWLDNKGYGIATPPDSPYRTPISRAIVRLQERGRLHTLKERWWILRGGGKCAVETKSAAAAELGIENVGGVFVVLAAGVGISCMFAVLEFIWKTMKVSRDERVSVVLANESTHCIPRLCSFSMPEHLSPRCRSNGSLTFLSSALTH